MKKFINIVLVLAFVLLTLLLGGSTFIDRDININVTFPTNGYRKRINAI